MKHVSVTTLSVAIALAFTTGAMAAPMTKSAYKSSKDVIEADYKAKKESCKSLAGNAKDICMVEAKGIERVALADLEAAYKPGDKSRHEAQEARVNASYAIATEKCDDVTGNPKDVCIKEAKAAKVAAHADAKAGVKTADARKDAGKEIAEARKDAASEKNTADYAVAKEKCEALAGEAKAQCDAAAKSQFGK